MGYCRSRLSDKRVVVVPIPSFFTEQQKAWVRDSASVDAQVGGEALAGWKSDDFCMAGCKRVWLRTRLPCRSAQPKSPLPPAPPVNLKAYA
jgi:hypothetical protein